MSWNFTRKNISGIPLNFQSSKKEKCLSTTQRPVCAHSPTPNSSYDHLQCRQLSRRRPKPLATSHWTCLKTFTTKGYRVLGSQTIEVKPPFKVRLISVFLHCFLGLRWSDFSRTLPDGQLVVKKLPTDDQIRAFDLANSPLLCSR